MYSSKSTASRESRGCARESRSRPSAVRAFRTANSESSPKPLIGSRIAFDTSLSSLPGLAIPESATKQRRISLVPSKMRFTRASRSSRSYG